MMIISMLSVQIDAFFSHLIIVYLGVLLVLLWHLIIYSFFPPGSKTEQTLGLKAVRLSS